MYYPCSQVVEELKAECDNKEKEITAFKEYASILEDEIKNL